MYGKSSQVNNLKVASKCIFRSISIKYKGKLVATGSVNIQKDKGGAMNATISQLTLNKRYPSDN